MTTGTVKTTLPVGSQKARRYDLDLVKQMAAGRWPEILSSVGGVPLDILDGRHHPCPKCGGSDRFRMIDPEAGAVFCNQCFSEKNGDGLSAVCWMRGVEFKEALQAVAEHIGAEPAKAPRRRSFDEQVKFDEQPHRGWVEKWATNKPGVSATAAFKAGVKTGFFEPRIGVKFAVVVFPAAPVPGGDPVGYIAYRVDGEAFPAIGKNGKPSKDRMLAHSSDGWAIVGSKTDFDLAHTLVKVEGLTDATAIADSLPAGYIAITNIAGANSGKVSVDIAAGKRVIVIGDADTPGQKGAAKFAVRFQEFADAVFVSVLPYLVTPTHGKDVRDFIAAGGSGAALVEKAEPFTATPGSKEKLRAAEADPMEEARHLLASESTECEKMTIRCHRDEWLRWAGDRYWRWPECDLRSAVVLWLDRNFTGLNKSLVTNVIECLRAESLISGMSELPCWVGEGEPKPNLIAVRNGLLDIDAAIERDGSGRGDIHDALSPHSPEWVSTVCLPYQYDPTAKCPLWESTLLKNVEGDVERVHLLQEWFGYCLLPTTSFQKFLMLYGEGGTGKSSTLAGLIALLGVENVSSVALERFGNQFALYGTLGKLANVAAEIGEVDKVAEGVLKSLTSGDRMEFERKHRDSIFAAPTARLIFSTNNLPRFADRSDGLWRRMILIPFERIIPKADRIANLDKAEFWQAKGELSGMLNWALEGLRRLREQGGFTAAAACEDALGVYRTESNPAKAFLLEQYRADPFSEIDKQSVYLHYQSWCEAYGYRSLSESHFAKEVYRTFRGARETRVRVTNGKQRLYAGLAKGGD